jgi:hypothetical protein
VRISPLAAALAVAVLAPAAVACGSGGGTAAGCGRTKREPLDKGFLIHVLGSAHDVDYQTDPPTSGPHQPTPEISGVQADPLPKPVQVGLLEDGTVLLQHRPDLAEGPLADLEALAGDHVVVAPNPDLPDEVVATAWLYKRTCSEVDVDALREFVDARAGKGPGGDGP